MRFDVKVTHEAACTRVAVQGEAKLGRMLSLLQVLELDSRTWPDERLLLDLREVESVLDAPEQERLVLDTARLLPRMRRIALLAPPGRLRDGAGVRVFSDEDEALRWLAA